MFQDLVLDPIMFQENQNSSESILLYDNAAYGSRKTFFYIYIYDIEHTLFTFCRKPPICINIPSSLIGKYLDNTSINGFLSKNYTSNMGWKINLFTCSAVILWWKWHYKTCETKIIKSIVFDNSSMTSMEVNFKFN